MGRPNLSVEILGTIFKSVMGLGLSNEEAVFAVSGIACFVIGLSDFDPLDEEPNWFGSSFDW